MKNKTGISKQLIIALSFTSLSVTLSSLILGYGTYYVAIEVGLISLEKLKESDEFFHYLDGIWLFAVLLFGTALSIILGIKLAQRFIVPINLLADAAKKISHGDLSARVEKPTHHSSEIGELMDNFNDMAQKLETSVENAHVWNAAIAHELRTPVTILQGRLQGIIDGVFEADPILFKNLLNQVEGLSNLVEDLRTLSLFENQQLRLNLETICFNETAHKVVHMFEEKLEKAQLKVIFDIEAPKVECDQRRIEQILIALLVNATRYANPGKLIVSTRQEQTSWILEIEDEGPGISAEHRKDLFNPFFRLEQSRNKELGGTGLGLSVVQALVIAHKGQVDYLNQHSHSIFRISIPQ
ncbi:two-component sensor histidine kinase AdeS [Acinetobacter pittii]|uniref:two-component sensor histidine kinase AdeS n=1 Tax=Acinetobacter pittii TaxID=48296 RepID=UPI000CE4A096|nr:two-component sensor histidine kinase AdeS [Acinetobacter pittii]PPC03703.1 two-component sensor histidine kinase AdeS [Acinetobacter pittii]WPP78950.1 two-component sensor histidine kinase AdeS [Acinetobacter pittii]